MRLPDALWVHIQDEATQRKRTFNAELIDLLMKPRRVAYQQAARDLKYRNRIEDLYGQGGLERLDIPPPEQWPEGWPNGYSDDILRDWFGYARRCPEG